MIKKRQILIICLIATCVIVLGGYLAMRLDLSQQEAVSSLNNQMEWCVQTEITDKSTGELFEHMKECLNLVADYNQMEWKQRIRVTQYKAIEERIQEIDSAVETARENEVAHVSGLIDDIRGVSLDSEAAIKEAEDAYLQLDAKQREEISNYEVLEDAKERIQYDKIYVNNTIKSIIKIGKVSLENGAGSRIKKAEKLYNSLTSQEKNHVTNYKILQQKRDKYDTLNGYCRQLKKAKANMRAGKLNTANRYLKKVPSTFKFKNLKASKLKKQMKAKNAWVKLCGKWKSTGGKMYVYKTHLYDDGWNGWERKINKGQKTISIRCKLQNNGKVKLLIRGSVPCFTNYSKVSKGLKDGNISLNKTVTASGMETFRINQYITMKLSTSR